MLTPERVEEARADLIRIGAGLLDAKWASDHAEDWPERPSGRRVARVAERDAERRRKMSIRMSEARKALLDHIDAQDEEIERLRREREMARQHLVEARDYCVMGSPILAHSEITEALALLDGAKGRVMDRGQDENDFIPPEQVDTGCPICGEPRLWCWCDGEKGGGVE